MAWTIKITSNRMKLKLFHWLKSTATKRNGFFHARVVRPCPIRFVQWIFVSTQMFHIFICLNWLFSWMSISIDGIFSFDFSLEMCFSVIVVVVHIIYRRKTNNEIAFAQKKEYAQHSLCVARHVLFDRMKLLWAECLANPYWKAECVCG